ncbi:NDUFA13, partial [Symbiodinium sp. KB8]
IHGKPYARGPPGYALLAGGIGVVAYGFFALAGDKEAHDYIQAAKVNERFERIYVLQAMEEASWARRHKEQLDRERAWMADQPDWVVARNVYYTDKGAPTSQNPLDPRTLSDLNPN